MECGGGPKQSVLAFEAHLITTTTTAHIQELINLQRQQVREYRTDWDRHSPGRMVDWLADGGDLILRPHVIRAQSGLI